jgi:hypothetical protein
MSFFPQATDRGFDHFIRKAKKVNQWPWQMAVYLLGTQMAVYSEEIRMV